MFMASYVFIKDGKVRNNSGFHCPVSKDSAKDQLEKLATDLHMGQQ